MHGGNIPKNVKRHLFRGFGSQIFKDKCLLIRGLDGTDALVGKSACRFPQTSLIVKGVAVPVLVFLQIEVCGVIQQIYRLGFPRRVDLFDFIQPPQKLIRGTLRPQPWQH
jgi:hypothetical protein